MSFEYGGRHGKLALRLILAIVALTAASWPRPVRAIDPSRHLDQLVHRAWQKEDGLPQSSVNAIAQDADGYLWVGTFGGLARFDGTRFQTVHLGTHRGSLGDRILRLTFTTDGTLWVGLEGGRLVVGKHGRFSTIQDLTHQTFVALIEAAGGKLWIGTSRRVYLWDGRSLTPYARLAGVVPGYVNAILPEADGTVLAGTDRDLLRISKTSVTRLEKVPRGLPVNCLLRKQDGTILAGTADGLLRIGPGGGSTWAERNLEVARILEDRDGGLWLGTSTQGLWRLSQGHLEHAPKRSGLSSGKISSLFEDREGNIWVGTARFGLHELVAGAVVPYGGPGSPLDHSVTAVAGTGHEIWAGLGCEGLVRIGAGGAVSTFAAREQHGRYAICIQSLLPASNGGLLLGAWQDVLYRFRAGRISQVARLPEGCGVTRAMLAVPGGRILLGTGSGLVWLDGGATRFVEDARDNVVFTLVRTSDGRILAGTDHGILELTGDDHVRTLVPGADISNSPARAILEEPEARGVWIGTYGGGLFYWKDGRTTPISAGAGLPGRTVSAIVADRFNHLWLSGNDGVLRTRRTDLLRIAGGGKGPVRFRLYTSRDGLPDTECNGGGSEAAWLAPDDSLWIPTLRGLARIETRPGMAVAKVRPMIETVYLGGKTVPHSALAHLPPTASNLEIDYTAIWFRNPFGVEFRYRLEGHDARWSEAGSRREAYYPEIPAGSHRFRLQARVGAGPWIEALGELAVGRRPRFTESAAFPIVIALGSAGLIGLFLLIRLQTARRRQRELETMVRERTEERDKLAALLAKVNEGRSLEEVLDFLWDAFEGLLPFDRIAYATIEKGMVRATWARTRFEPIRLKVGSRARLEDTSLKHLAAEGTTRIISDLDAYLLENPSSRLTRLLVQEGMRSSLLVPLRAFGEAVGFLFFNSVRTGVYTGDHARLLKAIGAQLSVIIEKSRLSSELAEQATTDPLTGLANRRAFEQHLKLQWRLGVRQKQPVALLLLDIDHFKLYNDRYGHTRGDTCLRTIAGMAASFAQRAGDLAARWGGEELVIVLYGTPLTRAGKMAERLRRRIEEAGVPHDASPVGAHVTVSIGVAAVMPQAKTSPSVLFAAVDQALYRAKEAGRNRVEVARPE